MKGCGFPKTIAPGCDRFFAHEDTPANQLGGQKDRAPFLRGLVGPPPPELRTARNHLIVRTTLSNLLLLFLVYSPIHDRTAPNVSWVPLAD